MVLINLQSAAVDALYKSAARRRYKQGAAGKAAAARYRARPETRAYMRRYAREHERDAEQRAQYKQSPEGKAASAKYKRSAAGKEAAARRYRNVTRGREYGLDPVAVERMFQERAGRCEICGREMARLRVKGGLPVASIDHDHRTGRVRGMLCVSCNTALGKMRDDPTLLRRAADYLEQHDV